MQINIEIKNRKASAQNFAVIRENSDYIVKFDFDAEWDGVPLKTARFCYGNEQYTDVAFTGDTVTVPALSNTTYCLIGVYTGNGDDELKTTTPAVVDVIPSILSGNPVHVAPPEDIYNQIINLINSECATREYVDAKIEEKIAELLASDAHKWLTCE